MTVLVPAPPTNDYCTNAVIISNTPYSNSQSTVGATDTGDMAVSCVSELGKGVWYRFTPATNGYLVVDTDGSSFDTGAGCTDSGALTQVACDDDGGVGQASRIVITAPAPAPRILFWRGAFTQMTWGNSRSTSDPVSLCRPTFRISSPQTGWLVGQNRHFHDHEHHY